MLTVWVLKKITCPGQVIFLLKVWVIYVFPAVDWHAAAVDWHAAAADGTAAADDSLVGHGVVKSDAAVWVHAVVQDAATSGVVATPGAAVKRYAVASDWADPYAVDPMQSDAAGCWPYAAGCWLYAAGCWKPYVAGWLDRCVADSM